MKQIFFTLTLSALSILSFAQGEPIKFSITITTFSDKDFEVFNPVDGQNPKIRQDIVEKGFLVSINKDISVDSFKILNKSKQYISYDMLLHDHPSYKTGYNTYLIMNPYTGENKDTIRIRIYKKNKEALIALKVEPAVDGSQETKFVRESLFNVTDKKSGCKSDDLYFGESVDVYNENTVVYVYDFNRDPSKRVFHKVTRVENIDNSLKIELESKQAIYKAAKKEFDKDKADTNKKDRVQIAQRDLDTAKIAFENSKFGLHKEIVNFNKITLTTGKNVRFKVYNVNKFMYDVSLTDTVVNYDSEPPLLFARFFLGDSTSIASAIDAFSSDVYKRSYSKNEFKNLNDKLSWFIQEYNRLQDEVLKAYDPCNEFECCHSISYSKLANYLASIRLDATKIQQELDDQKKLIAKCDKCKSDKSKIENEIKLLVSEIAKLPEKDKEKKVLELQAKKEELEIINNKTLKESCGVNDSIKKSAEKVLADFTAINQLLEKLPKDDDLKRIIVFLNNVVQQNNMHTSDYISLDGNLLELTLSITSKDSIHRLFGIPEYKSQINFQIPIIWKPFVSFSSGSFIAIRKNLQNKTYEWQQTVGNNNTVTDTSYTLVESGFTLPPMGFCALGNLEWKTSRSFGFGGSFGVGLSIEKSPRLAYLGGISLFFGDLRQFTTTFGFVGMQVNRLTNNFQTIGDNQVIYKTKPTADLYYKEFKVGAFIALTYTPFKVYKSKTVKSKDK